MARKIKFHSLHILFRLFAFLAEKTDGCRAASEQCFQTLNLEDPIINHTNILKK